MENRIRKLRIKLKKLQLDAFFVSNFYHILYLSGFKTLTTNEREALLLITKKNNYLFTDGRYYQEVQSSKLEVQNHSLKSKITWKLISPKKNLLQHLQKIIKEEAIEKLGFEADDLKFAEYQKISNAVETTRRVVSPIKLIPVEKLIIKLREIKDGCEIEKIKKACQISDRCLKEIVKTIKIGQTEKEIAFKIEFWLKEKGYDLAFYPIVAIDENSSLPHYDTKTNGQQKVKKNSSILVDFGAKYQNYCSDITRMIFVGKPTTEQLNIYRILLDSQQKTIEQCSKETMTKNLDSFCRQQLTNHQSPTTNHHHYPHSTGHGVGLEIHEYPKISEKSTDVIQKNQVFTIEPGVYFPGKFGIRIEDTVWMRKNNQPEILTSFTKQPTII